MSKPISTIAVSKIERQVMAGVGTVYAARQLTSVGALKIYALILSLWAVGRLVWVSMVFKNFMQVEKSGAGAITNYMVQAVEHTHLAVQLCLVVAVVAAASLALDTIRSISSPSHSLSF